MCRVASRWGGLVSIGKVWAARLAAEDREAGRQGLMERMAALQVTSMSPA
jgi:hypothetical protein